MLVVEFLCSDLVLFLWRKLLCVQLFQFQSMRMVRMFALCEKVSAPLLCCGWLNHELDFVIFKPDFNF